MLALVANGWWTETDRKALRDQEWSQCNHHNGAIVVFPVELLLACCGAIGIRVCEGGQTEIKPRCRDGLANRGMSKDYALLA